MKKIFMNCAVSITLSTSPCMSIYGSVSGKEEIASIKILTDKNEERVYSKQENDDCGDSDYMIHDFYLHPEPHIWMDGHMWAPVMLRHHPDCPCQSIK